MEEPTDYSLYHNPYDFANPITDFELFAGRKKERKEINYYLNQAKNSKSPINISFIGERASGKTSLLNLTEFKANELELITVRIDLDEGDTEYQLYFFHKIFNALFTKVCELGYFAGFNGQTYDVYLDLVNTYSIPLEKTFCPFLFPLQYAKALSVNNPGVQVSDENLKHDFKFIYSELNKPIVLLFDECDVLSNNRIILQKLRNIFMNQFGYMLVIAGTEKLFPTLDDVFSPIIRQFKKISVERFLDKEDTQECIEKPIERIGLNPKKIFDYETRKDILDIHHISSGKPYEIQLLCHVMFRRLQEIKTDRMQVNYSVLKEVTEELEKSQNISTRPLLVKLNQLADLDLLALSILCRQNGYLTFDQAWHMEFAFKGEKRWSKDSFEKNYNKLLKDGFIRLENDIIFFNGDDFDKIYIKYFSREKKLNVSIDYTHIDLFIYLEIQEIMKSINEKFISFENFTNQFDDSNITNIVKDFIEYDGERDDFTESHPILRDLYYPFILSTTCKSLTLIQINFQLPWIQNESYYYLDDRNCSELKSIESDSFNSLRKNLVLIGGEINFKLYNLQIPSQETLFTKLCKTSDKNFRDLVIYRHITDAVNLYMEHKKLEALQHTEIYLKYVTSLNDLSGFLLVPHLNNAGYMLMAQGKYSTASKCFSQMLSKTTESYTVSNHYLPLYNLAILFAFEKHYVKSKKEFEKIEEALLTKQFTQSDRLMGCLFTLIAKGKNVSHTEEYQIDILEATKNSLKALREIV